MADEHNTQNVEEPPAEVEPAAPEPAPAEPVGPPAEVETAAQPGAPDAAGELVTLRQELEAARAHEAEYLDGWQRARAELSNARKRFQRDQEQAYELASGQVLGRVLPIVDDFERALATLPESLRSTAPQAVAGLTWVEGIMLIYRKLQLLLEAERVTAIEALGQPFDPVAHQAVTHEPSQTVPEGHVIGEVQKGYRHGDRILRPALVRVSSGPPPETE